MSEWLTYVIWFATLFVVVIQLIRGSSTSGLLVCYWMILAINHLFGHIFLSFSLLSESYYDQSVSRLGFEVCGYALLGLFASLVAVFIFQRSSKPVQDYTRQLSVNQPHRLITMRHFGTTCISIGGILYLFGAMGLYTFLPSSAAIASSAQLLIISGILMKWRANKASEGKFESLSRWLWPVVVLFFPLYTTIVQGFIGFGITTLLIFCCFFWRRMRNRLLLLPLIPMFVYLALMLWASYAQIRTELRFEIGNKFDANTRFSILSDGIRSKFSWLDPDNAQQQMAFTRLNQNILIGESVNYLENGNGNPAYGDTFIEASIALVPRVLWPGKPAYGGSGGLVSRYTGLQFAEGTSVGIGQVMECYVNFGRWFVFILFFAVGVIVKLLDGAIENAFVTTRPATILLSFVIGVNWLNVIGSFSETFPAIVGAAVLALATIFLHNLLWSRYKV